jgi:catechol 2,3-dioxygenase-like lactoylglutathione lyase family enzyme
MTRSHITQAAVIHIPVSDQERALSFYVDRLGFEKRSDFAHADGERWLEVVPPGAITGFSLVTAGDERPAGIETGIALNTDDVVAAHADLRDSGVDVDPEILREGDPPVRWSGAVLAGIPPMFRLRDPDGNSFLIVQSP